MSLFHYRGRPGHFKRLAEVFKDKTRGFGDRLDQIFGTADSPITDEQIEDVENILLSADVGVQTTFKLIEKIKESTQEKRVLTSSEVRKMIHEFLLDILNDNQHKVVMSAPERCPRVIFIVGVNGVGKTTTVGKLAYRFSKEGKRVLICAADTFRAAASEQLSVWAKRTKTDIVKQESGSDPSAIVFDAMNAGKARNMDIVIVDTAGRLHTKKNLMQELEKMKRIAGRQVEGAPHDIYLILDATTGQNGLIQTQEFFSSVGVTGIVVTKLEGTAKGGIVVAVAREMKIPILYVGIGEKKDDLIPFSPKDFVDSICS